MATSYPRIGTKDGGGPRTAVRLARFIGRASHLWRQRGLGRIYGTLHRAPFLGSARCVVELSPGTFFETDVFEPFWAPTVIAGRPYEPELGHVFRRVAHLKPVLVDAGANYGYWSVVATSREVGFATALAIEASPSTFARLRANASLNRDRFRCIQRAVGARSGEMLEFTEGSGHITAAVTDARGDYKVETVTIDDAVRDAGLQGHPAFVLKLDVEGFELPALEGAAGLRREKEHLVSFEDFPDSGTRGFEHVHRIAEEGYAIFYVTGRGGCQRVASAADAHRLTAQDPKSGRSRNFFATRRAGVFFEVLDDWARQ